MSRDMINLSLNMITWAVFDITSSGCLIKKKENKFLLH